MTFKILTFPDKMSIIALDPSSYVRRLIESQTMALIQEDSRQQQKDPICSEPTLTTSEQPFLLITHGDQDEPFLHKYHKNLEIVVIFHKLAANSQMNGLYKQSIIVSLKAKTLNESNHFPLTEQWPRQSKYEMEDGIEKFPNCAPWAVFEIHPTRAPIFPKHLKVLNISLPIEQFLWKTIDQPDAEFSRFFPSPFGFITRHKPEDFLYGMSQDLSATSKSHLPFNENLPYPYNNRRGVNYSFDSVMEAEILQDDRQVDRENLLERLRSELNQTRISVEQNNASSEQQPAVVIGPELDDNLTKDATPDSLLNGKPLGSSDTTTTNAADVPTASIPTVEDVSDAVAKRSGTVSQSSSSTAGDANTSADQHQPAVSNTASGGTTPRLTRQDDTAKALHKNSSFKIFLEQIIGHVNTFSPSLLSCWLEPLVTYNENSKKFELDLHSATKANIAVIELLNTLQVDHQFLKYDRQKFIDFFERKLFRYKTMEMTHTDPS